LQKKRERLQQVQNVQVMEVPAAQPAQGPAVAEHISVRIGAQFLFEANSATLSPGGIDKIREIAATLNDDQNSRVIVKGYTSSEGGDTVNIPLSQNRANAVKNILMSERIDGARITALGMGSMEPIGDNRTETGRMMNRRVEIEVYQR
jgi:outer membrane protein OmpA-like peptidoglycan-associated protein